MKEVGYVYLEQGELPVKKTGMVVIDGDVEIRVNDRKPFKMTLLPRNGVDAALGRLYFMGLITSIDDVRDIVEEGSSVKFIVDVNEKSLEKVTCDLRVGSDVIYRCMKKLFESTDVWRLTGGVHSAGLFDPQGNLLYSVDDIGKGNAIDAVIGMGLRERLDFSKCLLASTGRQIGFMVEKAARAGIGIVIARGAPLSSSIDVASEYGITLACFVKGRSMNVYTGVERIID